MNNDPARYCASDKEIYDVLMSGKQRITETVMHDLSRERGIIYSLKESRESLADKLSLLPHGYHDLNALISHREHSGRSEKTTSVTLPPLSIEEIKEVAARYMADVVGDEKITSFQRGPDGYHINVEYSEIDYSKTRLVQRRKREAPIEFDIQKDRTVIRLPATEKGRQIVEDLTTRIASSSETEIKAVRIELPAAMMAEDRTRFFTRLITEMAEFSLRNATSVRVESSQSTETENEVNDEEDADIKDAEAEMLSLVQNVILKGQSLLSSSVYQELKKKGFFITSIIWDARQNNTLHEFQFEAAFEEPLAGKGFKYNVRGVRRCEAGSYTKTYRPVERDEKAFLFEVIEHTAARILAELEASMVVADSSEEVEGDGTSQMV